MATNAAQRLKNIETFIQEVKLKTSTPTPTKVGLSALVTKFKLSHYTIAALNDLGLLKYEQNGKSKLVQWAFGAGKIDKALINKVYENSKIHERVVKGKSVAKINGEKANEEKLVPQVAKVPSVKPTKVVAPKEEFAGVDGIIFGYKQLEYMSEERFKKPTDILINNAQSIPKVDLIRYAIEGSNLSIRFYRGPENIINDPETTEEALLTEIRVTNTALGLKRAGGDTQMHILKITLIPVKNPYKLV